MERFRRVIWRSTPVNIATWSLKPANEVRAFSVKAISFVILWATLDWDGNVVSLRGMLEVAIAIVLCMSAGC